jgi:ribosomal protein S18 acetylase RimI-like enzyme
LTEPNFERMIRLATEFFDAKNDPEQIAVTDDDRARLLAIHPATMTEERDDNGPIAWMLVIPTTRDIADRFVAGEISERTLLRETVPGVEYRSIYLCSALVLEEHRRRGLAERMVCDAVTSIRRDHPIGELVAWLFSDEGDRLASAAARNTGLSLRRRAHRATEGAGPGRFHPGAVQH